MKLDNPFDKRLEAQRRTLPGTMRDAAIRVTDTLDVAWAAVQAVFEKQAKPEHALMLLPHFLARADAELQRRLDEARAQTGGEPKSPPARRRTGTGT